MIEGSLYSKVPRFWTPVGMEEGSDRELSRSETPGMDKGVIV